MSKNVIVIMTDELRKDTLGCYGNKYVKTPHIDALSASGQRFDAAYTPSPICVPARASMATGRYVHETRCWANAMPYHGQLDSWHHKLRDNGKTATSIGKLHFRPTVDDNGFTEELAPLHIKDGKGWVHGLMRERNDVFDASGFARNIGPGEDGYTNYDRKVCAATLDWLRDRSDNDQGWVLFVSFLRPHYPLTCPDEFYALYDPETLPSPRANTPDHPVLNAMKRACNYGAPFTPESTKIAVASYYGLCSFVDDMVGQIMGVLRDTGLDQTTTVIFTSDHGECLGDRGFWTKMVMYEESAAVPLIMVGPGIEPGVCEKPVSLIDLYPTVLDITGVQRDDDPLHAVSLLDTLNSGDPERPILSEYHDYGAITGMFMLRKGDWKLVVYPGYEPQLFNLVADPGEEKDLSGDPAYADIFARMHKALSEIADPEAINKLAFADQEAKIAELGGREAILAMQNFDHTPVE